MKGLTNKRIAVAADRRADAIQNLIENMGGTSISFPSQGRQRLNEEVSRQNISDYLTQSYDWVILTTGIGARTLADSAYELGCQGAFIEKLNKDQLAIRGSKTIDWLKENELQPSFIAEDGTMENLLEKLKEKLDVNNNPHVFLQAYHQDDAKLKKDLEKLGCTVYLSKPYSFEPPIEKTVLQLKKKIKEQTIDAVVFTSKTQVINVFQDLGARASLTESFNDGVLAVAVGKVTAKELESHGIEYVLQPSKPKMGTMVVEMNRFYQNRTISAQ
ncbi:uroporphyrinogen-III synthase [Halobacillus yeomjeoni]|uniref:Uroporphyrinogen-III synthase n=1 Tax=Halobacillus yeomjeoni TaxID=311194 RepID=A0A931HTH5_9BACI|nr:uroporphyrinogen-III synthase [Halobacillus yeomjeoni]MBH0229460.1 uroporphyrinogen-III synthase [Halobacillus yeomjeoni]